MATDSDIYNWLSELGMKVNKVTGSFYFHLEVMPPIGEGLKVSVIRTSPNATYYIITTAIALGKVSKETLREVKVNLMRMNVEFYFTPPAGEPEGIQIAKLVFAEGLTKNEFLEKLTLVKNAAYLVAELTAQEEQ